MAVSDCSSIHSRLGFPNALTSVTFFCRSFCYLRRANFKVDFAFARHHKISPIQALCRNRHGAAASGDEI